jgi:putative redox protein
MVEHEHLASDSSVLELTIVTPPSPATVTHTLLIVHGLPRALGLGRLAAVLLPQLAEHLANESGWRVATGTMSGVGNSTGTFSATQWRRDLAVFVDRLTVEGQPLSLAGFGFGGGLALRQAATDERIRGVATFATPAHLAEWMGDVDSFYLTVINGGVVDEANPLLAPQALFDDVLAIDPLGAIAQVPPRRLLIGQGADDQEVPATDARDLVAAADGRAELRIIQSAGHQLRADPRMVATLLGWLDRHR